MHAPLLFLVLPVAATLTGGLLAVRFRRYRAMLLAVGAGLLLGAAFLDLLPEALTIGAAAGMPAADVLGLTLLFFLLFSALEVAVEAVGSGGLQEVDAGETRTGKRRRMGRMAVALLIFHSFRDGMAIGAAFVASKAAGYAVALGIAAHDFGDGMNTVILSTGGEKPGWSDWGFLALDAIAPFLGGLLTVWWLLSSRHATVLLALAAAFFLQMATSDFLPQLRRQPEKREWLLAGVLAGAAVIYGANLLL